MKPEWKRFMLAAVFFSCLAGAGLYAIWRQAFNPVSATLFAVGALGLALTAWLGAGRFPYGAELQELERRFADCTVYTLEQSRYTVLLAVLTFVFASFLTGSWGEFVRRGIAQRKSELIVFSGLFAFFLALYTRMWVTYWGNRLDVQRFESKRAAITSSGVAFIHRTAVKEATAENTKLVRIYAVQPTMVSV